MCHFLRRPNGPQGQEMPSHVCSLYSGHRICHRGENEGRWEREAGKERKKVKDIDWLLLSIISYFSDFLWRNQSWCWIWLSPSPEWTWMAQRNHSIPIPYCRLVQRWVCNPIRDFLWVFRERQASFLYKRYQGYLPFFFLVHMITEEHSPGGCWHHLVLQREKLPENEINI